MTENKSVEKVANNEIANIRCERKFRIKKWIGKNLLLILTLLGVILGVIVGFSLRLLNLQETAILLISYPGEIYMRVLKLVILPLIMSSLITGCSSVDAKLNGKIALRTFSIFIVTSMFNALLGVILGVTMRPGEQGLKFANNSKEQEGKASSVLDSVLDLGSFNTNPFLIEGVDLNSYGSRIKKNIAADNIFQATFQQAYTDYKNTTFQHFDRFNGSSQIANKMERVLKYRSGINNLGIVFFCIAFGTILSTTGSRGKVIKDFFAAVFEIIMKMVKGILWITPVGLCSIIAGKIISVENIALLVSQLGWLILTVILGVLFYQLIVLQLMYFLVVRKNPFKYYLGLFQGTVTAFAAASTSAALPINMDLMDNELNIDPRITRFVMPVGCNTNLDGTAMFIAISTIFIAQMSGFSLGTGNLSTIWFTATIMSFAVTSIPSSSLIILFMILSSIGIPSNNVPLLFAVDWFVDRFRTTNNMLGDCYTAAIVEKLSKNELLAWDSEKAQDVKRNKEAENLQMLKIKLDTQIV